MKSGSRLMKSPLPLGKLVVFTASLSVPAWSGCAPAPQPEFEADVTYDTVAEIGGEPAPENPLLVYEGTLFPQLLSERKAVFADYRGGRIIVVDIIDGSGWEVDDGGGDGPGEFSGYQPFFAEADGRIFTASQTGQAATWSGDGELLSTASYPEFIPSGVSGPVIGLLRSGVAVAHLVEESSPSGEGRQSTRQTLVAYSPVEGRVWEYELPPVVWEVRDNRATSVAGHGFTVDARLATVAFVQEGHRELTALNADGSLQARVDLPYDPYDVFIDADERLWVSVYAKNKKGVQSYVVYDSPDLSTPPRLVAEQHVEDARGDYLLTRSRNSLGIDHLHLLKERAGG